MTTTTITGCPVNHDADPLPRFPFDANGTRLPHEIAHLITSEPVKKVRTIASTQKHGSSPPIPCADKSSTTPGIRSRTRPRPGCHVSTR